MAGKNSVVQSNTLLVKWQEDKASFRKLVKDTTKGWEKIKQAQDKAFKKPSEVTRESRRQINAQKAVQKAMEQRLDKTHKQELRQMSAKEKANKRLAIQQRQANKESAAQLKSFVNQQHFGNKQAMKSMADYYKQQERLSRQSSVRPKGVDWQKQRERLTSTQAYKYQGLRYGTNLNIQAARYNITAAKTARQYKTAVNELSSALARERHLQDLSNRAKRQGTVLNERLAASMRQLVGELGSVYLAYEGLRSVVGTGMEFEKINKMFLSVSKDSQEAGENFEFVRNQALRLGLDLKQSGKEFSRYLAMVNESFSKTQAKDLFVSISELATTRGLSQEQIGRANIAISQMLAKGKIQAEELRG